ncbi:MAG: ATP-dependent zinc protease [Alphaproteobacteria bacterium]|nr:ATP-dependent zinc protease [Alphaproteobacteria bacterium]
MSRKIVIGWREWVSVPALDLPAIKAKIDTGARTSALHAFYVEESRAGGRHRVLFGLHPLQRRDDLVVNCEADVLDQRDVMDSGGHVEKRFVIRQRVRLGDHEWPIEITLTNRDPMGFRMLIGRGALIDRFAVDPAQSYVMGRRSAAKLATAYRRPRARKKRASS